MMNYQGAVLNTFVRTETFKGQLTLQSVFSGQSVGGRVALWVM